MNRQDKFSDLKPKALLSGDTMCIMQGILLYVWQLHHLNYFKRFKIVCIKLFSMKIYLLISYLFSMNIGSKVVMFLENFQNLAAILDFCQLG